MFVIKKDNLQDAVELLQKGKVLVFPTETSYGLGCDTTNRYAVEKIFQIKNRDAGKPLLVLTPSVFEAKKYLKWNEILENLSKKYWPGPLTIVGEYDSSKQKVPLRGISRREIVTSSQLAAGVVANDGTVAMRVTEHPVAKKLTEALGSPIVATSANISGQENIYSAEEAIKIFANRAVRPDAILDFGVLPKRPPTTVVSVVGGEVRVLRQGQLSLKSKKSKVKSDGVPPRGTGFLKVLFLAAAILIAFGAILYFWKISNIEILNIASAESLTGEIKFPPKSKPARIKARGLYLTAYSAGSAKKINEIIALAQKTGLNAVVIDIKDYSGKVLYNTAVQLAVSLKLKENRIGKVQDVIKKFHDKGIYVIARQTVFQDPILAEKKPAWAIKSKKGGLWRDYKGLAWVDPTNKDVWKYNLAIAKEAAALGFDEINFDYMRFPSDGNMNDVVYSNGNKKRYEAMGEFYRFLSNGLKDEPVWISIDMFGLVMEAKGEQDMNIGQRLADAVDNFDYICPMMYPSHYPSGHLNLKNPAEHPAAVFENGIAEGMPAFKGKRAKFRPWLQAFNLGAVYDGAKIRAQIDAVDGATDAGWLLWNASNRYTAAGLK